MAWCGYVSSESSKKCCRKWDAASRSGVRISTRSWVLARVMLSRFMYSIVSETMVSGSCGLCRVGMSSGILSSGPNFATFCADSWQTNLYCVIYTEDAKLKNDCIFNIITFACKCCVVSRVEALRIRKQRRGVIESMTLGNLTFVASYLRQTMNHVLEEIKQRFE